MNINKEKIQSVLKEYDWVNDEKQCLEKVKQDGWLLRHLHKQTDEICLAAVKQDGWLLQYVVNKTDEICLAAVEHNGWLLPCVHKQTDEICLAAVKHTGRLLQYVVNKTDEICLAAVEQDADAIYYVPHEILKKWLNQDDIKERINMLENKLNELKRLV